MASTGDDATFDVIVVGAGPAGCVLASRLSEDSQLRVLLLDAGADAIPGEEHPDILDPFAPIASRNPSFHWPELTAETGAAPKNGTARMAVPYLQAWGVGGASNINGMGADRGQPDDYDEWRDLGATGWSWCDVLPYFRKVERDLDFQGARVGLAHGDCGPIPVRRMPRNRWPPFSTAIAEALQRQGLPFLDDYNADFREGVGAAPTNSLPNQRMSASMAYLSREVRARSNLTVMANAHADRLRLEGRRATGIYSLRAGETRLMTARQVVLCCGALQTPLLMMRSGIGPGQHLAKHGIFVVKDLCGVGANLQNHPYVVLTTHLPQTAAQPADNLAFLQNWARFSSNHGGCPRSDMHLMPFNKCDWHQLGHRIGAVVVSVFKPYSKGSVELSASDPRRGARICFNLLDDPRDFDRLVSGLRFTLNILEDPLVARLRNEIFVSDDRMAASLSRRSPWNRFRAGLITSVLDRARMRQMLLSTSRIDAAALLTDDEAARDFVRTHAQPQYHVCGTCRMGGADDPAAVVNAAGEVHGIGGLRVADAAIFPTIPRANTHMSVLMAAEKIAAAILADGRQPNFSQSALAPSI